MKVKTMMIPTSKINLGFVGNNYADLVYYMSRVYYHLGHNVMVVDCSGQGEIMHTIPDLGDLEQYDVDYRGIRYCSIGVYKDQFAQEDLNRITFFCFGEVNEQFKHFPYEILQAIYLVTSIRKQDVLLLKECIEHLPSLEAFRILRNHVKSRKLQSFYYQLLHNDKIDILEDIVCPLTEESYVQLLDYEYNHMVSFKNLQNQLKDFILESIQTYAESNEKQIKKAYKVAERGR